MCGSLRNVHTQNAAHHDAKPLPPPEPFKSAPSLGLAEWVIVIVIMNHEGPMRAWLEASNEDSMSVGSRCSSMGVARTQIQMLN